MGAQGRGGHVKQNRSKARTIYTEAKGRTQMGVKDKTRRKVLRMPLVRMRRVQVRMDGADMGVMW